MMTISKIKLPDDPLSSNLIAGAILSGTAVAAGTAYSLLFEQLSRFSFATLFASLLLFLVGAVALVFSARAYRRPIAEPLLIIATIVVCSIVLIYLTTSNFTLPNPQLQSSEISKPDQHLSASGVSASPQMGASIKPDTGAYPILFFPSGAILFALFWQLSVSVASRENAKRARHNVGFAATGILAIQSTNGTDSFLLVLNKNLRDGKGLWVPPGGHVDLFTERPEDRVVEKTLLETGFDAKIIEVHSSMLPPVGVRKTDLCTWHTPPAFFLREDLQGPCSKSHRIHLDFVYILLAATQQLGRPIKYGHTDRILIPIMECASSHDAAKVATAKAIDTWRVNQGLNPAAMLDNCTVDVTMRLHLAAQHLFQAGIIK